MEYTIAIFHGLGDCINSTVFITAIKNKDQKNTIRWITCDQYKGVIENNPNISDKIFIKELPLACDKLYAEIKRTYKNKSKLILPAPYMTREIDGHMAGDGTLLGSYVWNLNHHKLFLEHLTPVLYISNQEEEHYQNWLKENNIKNYIMLETKYTSAQSLWTEQNTETAIKILTKKGYSILLSHMEDKHLDDYRKYGNVHCLNLNYRYIVPAYNNSKGFIGVSSSASCISHTHMCKRNLPHIEFVRGRHWATHLYKKDNKIISYDTNKLEKLIKATW